MSVEEKHLEKTGEERLQELTQYLNTQGMDECMEVISTWVLDGVCDALEGCSVEPDGHCPHNKPSWLLYLGMA